MPSFGVNRFAQRQASPAGALAPTRAGRVQAVLDRLVV